MAIEYDSDDIGELDEDAEDTIQGPATVEQFDSLLNEFLEDHPTQDHNHEAGFAYDSAAGSLAGAPADRSAIAKVLDCQLALHDSDMTLHDSDMTSHDKQYSEGAL